MVTSKKRGLLSSFLHFFKNQNAFYVKKILTNTVTIIWKYLKELSIFRKNDGQMLEEQWR